LFYSARKLILVNNYEGMKNRLLQITALSLLLLCSCKQCVDCSNVAAGVPSSNKICKGDYDTESKGVSWSSFQAALKASGCK
jgi:hypothetical protein